MVKFLGNRIGFAVTTSSDGGIFNSFSQQVFLSRKQKYPPFVTASGGNEEFTHPSNGYKYHIFTSSGNFTVTSGGLINYTIVSGGGGGGLGDSDIYDRAGGGGGAGGMISGTTSFIAGTYTITIGAGGIGGYRYPGSGTTYNSENGTSSKIELANWEPLYSDGGGRGAQYATPNANLTASPGGSGGGVSGENQHSNTSGFGNNPTSFGVAQGYPGGTRSYPDNYPSGPSFDPTGYLSNRNRAGGGGGGAGGRGGNTTNKFPAYGAHPNGVLMVVGGAGGLGRSFGVVPEDDYALDAASNPYGYLDTNGLRYFAGGGGGGGGFLWNSSSPFTPSGNFSTAFEKYNPGPATHGGGDGGRILPTSPSLLNPGQAGDTNTGGGGGGGAGGTRPSSTPDYAGGSGGSGIIILSYTV